MSRRKVLYHTSTKAQRLSFEGACVRSLNRWAEVLDIESWDIDFKPLYGKTAKEYNENRGQGNPNWSGFHVTTDSAYRRACVRAVVVDPSDWHIDEDELARVALHELLHAVLSPLKEECILPWIEGNDDQMRAYRYLDEHVTTQLERSIFRIAGPTRTSKKNGSRH